MSYYTKDSYEANRRYKAKHIRKLYIDMQKEEYARLKVYCENIGKPVATLLKELIRERIGTPEQKG